MLFNEAAVIGRQLNIRTDALVEDHKSGLIQFVNMGLVDAGVHTHDLMTEKNPDGAVPTAAMAPSAPSLGKLAELKEGIQSSFQDRKANPVLDRALKQFAKMKQGGALEGDDAPPSRGRSEDRSRADRSRSASPSHRGSSSRGGPFDALFDPRVKDTPDGKGFYFTDENGSPKSQTFSYEALERASGRSRQEIDFAVVIDFARTSEGRFRRCRTPHLPCCSRHDSSAHVCEGLAEKVHKNRQDFALPAGQ